MKKRPAEERRKKDDGRGNKGDGLEGGEKQSRGVGWRGKRIGVCIRGGRRLVLLPLKSVNRQIGVGGGDVAAVRSRRGGAGDGVRYASTTAHKGNSTVAARMSRKKKSDVTGELQ